MRTGIRFTYSWDREFSQSGVSCMLRQSRYKVVVLVTLGARVSHALSVSSAGRAVITSSLLVSRREPHLGKTGGL